jgi:Rieske Fe-S protein
VVVLGTAAITGVARLVHGSSSASARAPALGADGSAGSSSGSATSGSATVAPSASGTPTPTSSATSQPSATAGSKPAGTKIGLASAVPVKGAATFQDPSTGDPAIVVQPRAGTFLGFDAVCPHAGCTVAYDESSVTFMCPCHGSQFNGSTGAVEVGPASRGLGRIAVAEGSDGQLYAQ